MAWLIGVDEAGYGPNLGPFVMTSVACRLAEAHIRSDLWQLLAPAVRKMDGSDDPRLPVDDSKLVYSTARGLAMLERSVHACLGLEPSLLNNLLETVCPDDLDELRGEPWFLGESKIPVENFSTDFPACDASFADASKSAGDLIWRVRCVVVCPSRFNAMTEASDSKGAVLAECLGRLLRWNLDQLPGADALTVFIDKHGGRNTYAAQLQHALPDSIVFAQRESMARSMYQVMGLRRDVAMTFQPRADGEHFCAALASMMSKYLREVLMREFNNFWAKQVAGLKPTAGYPGDSARFFKAIRPALVRLRVGEETVWRNR